MLSLVTGSVPERQPATCSACAKRSEYRANAAKHFATFKTEFSTKGVTDRQLRAVFPLHADKRLVEAVLVLAWHRNLPAWRLREITKSFNFKRCCSSAAKCWLHQQLS